MPVTTTTSFPEIGADMFRSPHTVKSLLLEG
jgi:hypothetical protein